jgi:cell division protein FtsQ
MSIDPRLRERRKTIAEDNAKRSVSRLLKFLMFVMVAGAGVWLAFSPWLSVSQVTTTGIQAGQSHSVLVDHGVTAGTPMILISEPTVERALLEDPWVAEAEVGIDWPDRVTVAVVERVPVAWVLTETGWTRRALDGVALPSDPDPDDEMARIEMPDLDDEEALESAELLGALEFVAHLDGRFHSGTVVTSDDGETWATVSGFQVRLGRPVDMGEKALSLGALLNEDIAEGSTLVLIAPTNPAVMTPSGSEQTGSRASSGEGEEVSGDAEEGNDDS